MQLIDVVHGNHYLASSFELTTFERP
jgi:hypothetical protein